MQNNLTSKLFLLFVILLSAAGSARLLAAEKEIVVGGIVASVNGEPITLHELCQRLSPPRNISFSEASLDAEARQVLDEMILEILVVQEAEAKRVGVSEPEIETYINRVAERNNLSREEFEAALVDEGNSIDKFKNQVKIEVLKSKLASELIQSAAPVTAAEIDSYLEEHPELTKSGSKIKLRQIFISSGSRGQEAAKGIIDTISDSLDKGADFAELAREYSDSPEGKEGGLIGVIDEKDLGPEIFDAVFSLKTGEHSAVIEADDGFRLFFIEQRISSGSEEEQDADNLREEVAEILKKQKLEAKLHDYFTFELFESYTIDKKI